MNWNFFFLKLITLNLAINRVFALPNSCTKSLRNYKFNYYDDIHSKYSSSIVSKMSFIDCSNSSQAIQLMEEIEKSDQLSRSELILQLDLIDQNSTIHFKNKKFFSSLLYDNNFGLMLSNVKNFSITSDSETGIPYIFLNQLILKDSYFGFYYHQTPIEQICKLNLDFLFSSKFWFERVIIYDFYIEETVNFPKPICPIPFYYFEITNLYFYNLSIDRMPNFIDSGSLWNKKRTMDVELTPVYNLHLINGTVELSKTFIEMKIFNYLATINLLDVELVQIEEDVFKHLSINILNLKLTNFEQFITKSNNTWLNYFNYHNRINFKDCVSITNKKNMKMSYQSLIKLQTEYTFPDEHFCSFANFPHENLVFVIIQSVKPLKCTCTLIWLLQNYRFEQYLNENEKNRISIQTESVQDCIKNFDLYNRKCDIESRLNECGIVDLIYSPQCSLNKNYFNKECWIQFFEIFFILIIGLLGTLFGIITLIVLNDKCFKQTMYIYLKMVVFNQTISFFTLLPNVVIYPNLNFESYLNAGVNYCKIDYRLQEPAFRKFKIYVSDFLGYYVNMNSLFCNLFLTLDRFLFVSNSKNFSWFKGKEKMQRKLLVASALVSLVLNLNQLFTCADYDCLKLSTLVKFVFAFGYLIQDCVFIILTLISFIINIFLIKFLRQSFKKKSKILSNVENRSAEADETKALIMVIVQCFLIIVSRIPDILLSMVRIKLTGLWWISHDENFTKLNVRLGALQTTNLIVSNLVILFDILIAYVFNKKLRETFYVIFKVKKNDVNYKKVSKK